LVARLDSRGNNVPRRLVGVVADPDPAADPLTFGMTLHAPLAPPAASAAPADPASADDPADPASADDPASDKVQGTITSAAWSPELHTWIALAYLHRTVEAPGPVRIRSGDGIGGARPAMVALLPLIDSPGTTGVPGNSS
jgi:glycine cleavage system aminomethyltransferase T